MTTTTPNLAIVIARLERLERQNRLWKALGLLILVSLGGAALAGAAFQQANVTSAKEFALVDDKGNTRAKLFMMESGQPALALYDGKGKERCNMQISGNGPRFVCLSPSGDKIMSMVGADANGGHANLWSRTNQNVLSASPGNLAVFQKVSVTDDKGRERVRLAVGNQGTDVTFLDPAGKIFSFQAGHSLERGGFMTGRDNDDTVIFGMSDRGLFVRK